MQKDGIQIRFEASDCAACPLRAQCTTAKTSGRSLHLSPYYEQLVRDRRRVETEQFRREYKRRAPVEATISHLMNHCGSRVSRYRGGLKRKFHAFMSAAALNVKRALASGRLPAPAPA